MPVQIPAGNISVDESRLTGLASDCGYDDDTNTLLHFKAAEDSMKLRILPPEGADVKDSYRHLKHVVRVKTKATSLRPSRLGYLVATGPIRDLVMLKFVLPRFGYRLA